MSSITDEPRDILLQADKSRITEVISNLLSNAIKFTSEGTITISVEKAKPDKNNNKNRVIVSVKDTGQGIDASILPRLFTKFASYNGTGLGLFISKGIVEVDLGKIWGKNNVRWDRSDIFIQFASNVMDREPNN